ncbi:MAG: thioredoxin domain-containing protein, partial [Phycisphaerae bacterium]
TGRKDLREKAEGTFKAFASQVESNPAAYEKLLSAVDFYHDTVKEIVIVGDPNLPETRALIRTIHERYLPNRVIIQTSQADTDSDYPLLKNRVLQNERPTAYVCEDYRCKLPVNDPAELAQQLGR